MLDGVHCDALITAGVVKTVMSAWDRDQHWLRTEIWPIERPRKIALLRQPKRWDGGEEEVPIVKVPILEVDFGDSEVEAFSPDRECAPRRKRVTKVWLDFGPFVTGFFLFFFLKILRFVLKGIMSKGCLAKNFVLSLFEDF